MRSISKVKVTLVKNICALCIYKVAEYTTGEYDCKLYGRVKDINICDDYRKSKMAS